MFGDMHNLNHHNKQHTRTYKHFITLPTFERRVIDGETSMLATKLSYCNSHPHISWRFGDYQGIMPGKRVNPAQHPDLAFRTKVQN